MLCVIQLDQPINNKHTNHAPQVVPLDLHEPRHTLGHLNNRFGETHVLLKCHVHLHPGNRGQQKYTLERFSQGSGRNKKNRTTTYGTPQNRRFANSESSFAGGLQAFLLLFVQQYHSNDCKLRMVYASIHLKCQKLQIIPGPNVLSFEVNDLIHSMQGKSTNKWGLTKKANTSIYSALKEEDPCEMVSYYSILQSVV